MNKRTILLGSLVSVLLIGFLPVIPAVQVSAVNDFIEENIDSDLD